MYLDFYGLSQAPFHMTPDPEFFFLSPSHQAAWGALAYGMASRQGCVAIFGADGVGKTTLLRVYCTRVHQHELKTLVVTNPQLSFDALLRFIFQELGLTVTTDDPLELVRQLLQALNKEARQGRHVVLILDEAHTMPVDTLAQLPLLSTLEDATSTPLHIVLVGQPELRALLQQDTLQHLERRIVAHSLILPLTRKESLAYIYRHLAKVTQDTTPIFTAAALRRIIQHARGVPRALNILCTNACIAGFTAQQKPITAALIHSVIADLEGTKPMPAWQRGLAFSAALALLASLLWLTPWQRRHDVPTIAPRPAPAQADARAADEVARAPAQLGSRQVTEAGARPGAPESHLPALLTQHGGAASAAAAQQPDTPTTSEDSAAVLDTQAMQGLLTRLKTPSNTHEEQLDTQAMDNLVARLEPGDKTKLPAAPDARAERKRGAKALPRAAEDHGGLSLDAADHPPAKQIRRPQSSARRGESNFAISPRRSERVPARRAPVVSPFDRQSPTPGDDGGG